MSAQRSRVLERIPINVVPERVFVPRQVPAEEYAHIERMVFSNQNSLVAAGHDVADDAAARVRNAEGKVDGEEVVIGNPAREIVAAADCLDTDCIVMGRRGLGDVGGLLLGSVSHKVGHLTDKTLITTQ